MPPLSNPFATRFVRPGAIEFIFPIGETAERLVDRLADLERCAIVGPHGSGKSTLLESLISQMETRQWNVVRFALRDGQRRLPNANRLSSIAANRTTGHAKGKQVRIEPEDDGKTIARTVVVIDGFEQLGWWSRRSVVRSAKKSGWYLLVTSHRALGLPTLFTTDSSDKVLEEIVRQRVPNDEFRLATHLDRIRAKHGANVREALFELYDLWQLGQRGEEQRGEEQHGEEQRP